MLELNCVCSILFSNKKESALQYFQILGIFKFKNIVKLKIGLLTHKLFMNPTTVPAIFNDFLLGHQQMPKKPLRLITFSHLLHVALC